MNATQNSGEVNTNGGAVTLGNITVSDNGLFVGRDYYEVYINRIVYDFDRIFAGLFTHLGIFKERKLEELKAFSKGRCLERWLALGVPDEKAALFLNNPIFDRTEQVINLEATEPLKILVGDFGVGKSLIVEKLFQKLVDNATSNHNSPVPIYIPSDKLTDDLFNDIRQASELIGDFRRLGARVIVDGADEISPKQARSLLQQAIRITKANPKIRIVIASRPIPDFERDNLEKVIVPELSNVEIVAIVKALSGHEQNHNFLYGLPQSVLDALKKPFFAILFGLYQQQLDNGIFKSEGELISHLVQIAVRDVEETQVIDLLEKLAILSTERESKYIPDTDIGSLEQIRSLLSSRLVVKRGNMVGFALPVLAQWFAAKGLEKDKISIEHLTANIAQIEKWRYPIIILISYASFENASRILVPIAENHPSILAELVDGAINRYRFDDSTDEIGLPTAQEMGNRIVRVLNALLIGIGPLGKYILPINNNGRISVIGVNKADNIFHICWYGNMPGEGIVELDEGFRFGAQKGIHYWSELRQVRFGAQDAEPWHFSLDSARERLQRSVQRKDFPLFQGYMFKEKIWKISNELMQYGDLSHRPISINDLLKRVDERRVLEIPRQLFLNYINELKENGDDFIAPLWPIPDKEYSGLGGWIWNPYSPERVFERIQIIFESSLKEYVSFVDTFFKPFSERLTTYAILPAKLTGYLEYSNESWGLNWYFDPLNEGKESFVDIHTNHERYLSEDPRQVSKKLQKMRPGLSRYYSSRHQSVDEVFGQTPVTDLVYDWLLHDLRDISWIR